MPIDVTNTMKLIKCASDLTKASEQEVSDMKRIRTSLDVNLSRTNAQLSDIEKTLLAHDIWSSSTDRCFDKIACLRYEYAYDAYKALHPKVLKHARSTVVKSSMIHIAFTFFAFTVIMCSLQYILDSKADVFLTGLVSSFFFTVFLCSNSLKELIMYFRFKWKSNNPDVRVCVDVMDAYTRDIFPDYYSMKDLRILTHNLYLEFQNITTTSTKKP